MARETVTQFEIAAVASEKFSSNGMLIGGLAGLISILFLLVKMNSRSVTTMAVINLVVVHGLFLMTVPFRLAYLIKGTWTFGLPFCKFVSAMLHIHMYLTFLFYVVILVI
ncbi:hypothetical protein STEG23_008646, partial [Scotinomys teguina]